MKNKEIRLSMSSCCGIYFQWKSGRSNGKLPYLKELGIDAIELMPVQEFAGNDSWGYNTGLYFALDASYGTQMNIKLLLTPAIRMESPLFRCSLQPYEQ